MRRPPRRTAPGARPRTSTIRSDASPVTVSVSGPVAATVAPAFASAAIASERALVRRVTRPAEAAAISSATLVFGHELAAADHDQVVGGVLELAHQVA